MKLSEIIDFLEEKIPKSLALKGDKIGFKRDYDLAQNIELIKIYMDLLPEDDNDSKNTLIITHHPPLFIPKTPTYTIHSNWDIIDGGANEALAKALDLEVMGYFDENTNIGRVCKADKKFIELKNNILMNFNNVRIVNNLDDEKIIKKIGIISGFGLKNPDYIHLAKTKDLDILISGDLTQETAILAENLGITLIDLTHHESEVPGLYALRDIIKELVNLMQVHRGGPKTIGAFDGQKIDSGDVIFTLLGAEIGQNKPDFIKQLCTHKKEFREVLSYPEYITDENLDSIKGDVVIIVIAGGNTIPTAAKIIKHAHKKKKKTIGTAGIFGYGNENIKIKDISEYDDTNPAVEELRKEGISENHLILTTNKLIRDNEPVTPYTLDEVAKIITLNALKLLDDKI